MALVRMYGLGVVGFSKVMNVQFVRERDCDLKPFGVYLGGDKKEKSGDEHS